MCKAPTISQFARSFGTHEKLPGRWQGTAYRYHPHGFIFRPMVYTDHHHVSGHCDAAVMTDPTSPFRARNNDRDASCYGSPDGAKAVPERGGLVMVYDSGKWVGPDGPWRQQMRNDMANVFRQLRLLKWQRKREQEEKAKAAAARETAIWKAARSAFQPAESTSGSQRA